MMANNILSRLSSWRLLYSAILLLSILFLLHRGEPCAAFRLLHTISPTRRTNIYSPFSLRSVIGDSPDTGKPALSIIPIDEESTDLPVNRSSMYMGDSPDTGKSAISIIPIDEKSTDLLVDRSSVHIVSSFPDISSPNLAQNLSIATNQSLILEVEENELEEVDELCYLDDIPVTDAGQTCFVSDSSSLSSDPNSSDFLASLPFNTRDSPTVVDTVLRFLPFIMPVFAYFTYEPTAKLFNIMVEIISSNNWVAVDGGQYQATIITPAINGLVVPSIALLFATLMSNTINTLRQRQLQIRTSLNTEANDMRMLSTMVDSLPVELREVKNHLREYLIQYSSRVVAESRPGLSVDLQIFIGSMDK
jgi:hypothetical protein